MNLSGLGGKETNGKRREGCCVSRKPVTPPLLMVKILQTMKMQTGAAQNRRDARRIILKQPAMTRIGTARF